MALSEGAVTVVVGGIGPAAAAAAAATALSAQPADVAVCAGIAGGFPGQGLAAGAVVVADAIIAAELGIDTDDGVVDLHRAVPRFTPPAQLVIAVRDRLADVGVQVRVGPVLTVSTVTGTAARLAELEAAHDGALAEAMEGSGVAHAAAMHGRPAFELRTISNPVGPRDRSAWQIPAALDALTKCAGTALAAVLAG